MSGSAGLVGVSLYKMTYLNGPIEPPDAVHTTSVPVSAAVPLLSDQLLEIDDPPAVYPFPAEISAMSAFTACVAAFGAVLLKYTFRTCPVLLKSCTPCPSFSTKSWNLLNTAMSYLSLFCGLKTDHSPSTCATVHKTLFFSNTDYKDKRRAESDIEPVIRLHVRRLLHVIIQDSTAAGPSPEYVSTASCPK